MNTLSDAFHDLAESNERAFATAPRDASALAHARRARHRTRALQATGGTLAVGALTVGGIQGLPALSDGVNPAGSPSATPSGAPTPTVSASEPAVEVLPSRLVNFDTSYSSTFKSLTLKQFHETYACDMPAPTPTNGRATISLDSVSIRPEPWVLDLSGWADGTETGPVPIVDAEGHTQYVLIAETSMVATGGETLHADVPATMVLLAKDEKIVGMVAPGRVDPTQYERVIDDPTNNGPGGQDIVVVEYGVDPTLTDEPSAFTTGHVGWTCPVGFGDVYGDTPLDLIYPPMSDYLEPGDYQAYAVARVIVNDSTSSEHYLRDQGFDFWSYFNYEEQLAAIGLGDVIDTYKNVEIDGDTYNHLFINLPVPGEYLTDQPMDQIIVSEPLTITIQ